jgi:hypothetical protein
MLEFGPQNPVWAMSFPLSCRPFPSKMGTNGRQATHFLSRHVISRARERRPTKRGIRSTSTGRELERSWLACGVYVHRCRAAVGRVFSSCLQPTVSWAEDRAATEGQLPVTNPQLVGMPTLPATVKAGHSHPFADKRSDGELRAPRGSFVLPPCPVRNETRRPGRISFRPRNLRNL